MTEVSVFFTIGHSSHRPEAFMNLLKQHRIELLVDVRSHPFSRAVLHFNNSVLTESLSTTPVKYLYLGRELGGRPSDPTFYDDSGRVLYFRLADSPLYQEGIQRLEKGIRTCRVAIMCSEEDPTGCHRHLLIARTLAARGYLVCHIRGDGRVQSEELLATQDKSAIDAPQTDFFEPPESTGWKSIRSVSRRGRRPDSSAR